MRRKVFRIISWGGLGDVLLSTPCFKALKREYPNSRVIVYARGKGDLAIFGNNPFIDRLRTTSFLANPITYARYYFKLAPFYELNYGRMHPAENYQKKAADLIAEILGLKLEDNNVQIYLTDKEDAAARKVLERYRFPITIQTTALSSINKNWPLENWERLIASLPELTFIQLGLPKEDPVKGAVDLRGKTSVREALAIVKHCKGFVGVDSVFSHATNAFGVPGVVLFGASTPTVWGHDNNKNIYKKLRCAPCIDVLLASKCPYNRQCMQEITVEEVREAVLCMLNKEQRSTSIKVDQPHPDLKDAIIQIGRRIGNTPLHKLNFQHCNLFVKLECHNAFGSIKDRPALFILEKALAENIIDQNTTVVESTSGNFGIALASICKAVNINFIPVIDPTISDQKEKVLRLLSYDVVKVTERDETGGYLLNRIKKVRQLIYEFPNGYNPNQYENPNNYLSYYHTLGHELCNSFSRLDFAFVCVSSCGTIIGLSNRLKEKFPDVKIIAVDIEGSMIFSNEIKLRRIPGIGSSIRSPLMGKAIIDDIMILSQEEIVKGAFELLNEHSIFLGASSGAAYMAAKMYLGKIRRSDMNAVIISPDSGASYLDNIYSPKWARENLNIQAEDAVYK